MAGGHMTPWHGAFGRGRKGLLSGLALALLTSAAAAQAPDRIAPEAYPHHRVLEQMLNRTGPYSSLMFRDGPCRYRHGYGKDIAKGIWIDRETPLDFATLDIDRRALEPRDDGAVQMLVVPLRADSAPITHRLALTDFGGTLHAGFVDRYGGHCDEAYCDAEVTDTSVSIALVGPPSAAEIDKILAAVVGMAAFCASADRTGD